MGNRCIKCVTQVESNEEAMMERLKSGQIQKHFTSTYNQAPTLTFPETTRCIVFSDIHRGNGDAKSDFSLGSEATYKRALQYYYDQNFVLIHNGDIEDAWMHPDLNAILQAHQDIYREEKKFFSSGRYIRLVGNHDDIWYNSQKVEQYLHPLFPKLAVFDGLHLKLGSRTFFILHGHQGSYDVGTSDECCAKYCLRCCFTPLMDCCNTDKTSYQVPSTNIKLSNQLDRIADAWSQEMKTHLIMSHTHSPVLDVDTTSYYNRAIPSKHKNYFNTGCCCYN